MENAAASDAYAAAMENENPEPVNASNNTGEAEENSADAIENGMEAMKIVEDNEAAPAQEETTPESAEPKPEANQAPLREENESQPTRPRLVIQSLVLENFKSYGGCVKIGPFHKRFSSIVGPNGSGKSNVIDAMLFVFGRRAKQLRHSKMSELLHHSEIYPDVTSGTVTVNFQEIIDTGDGDDDFEVVPNSHFAVARKAFKNNTSKYYLNGKETQMKSVIALLKSKGVDLDNNRFLILQGEVEQIAMMKPKAVTAHEDGLLEYLEDIIGTNQYVEEIESLAAQVEALNEERTHKLNRVKAVQKERDALEGAKNEAETFLEKEKEFYTKKGRFVESRIAVHMKDLGEHNEVYQEAKAKLEESEKLFAEREKHVNEFDEKFNAAKKRTDELRKKLNDALNAYAAFERRDILLRENIKALKQKSKKLKEKLEKEGKKKEQAAEDVENYQEEKSEAEKECAKMEKKLADAEAELERVHQSTREATAPIRAQLEEKQKELMPFTDTVNKCKQDLEVAKTELQLLIAKRDEPARLLAEKEQTLVTLQAELNQAEDVISAIDSEKHGVEMRLQELTEQQRGFEKEIADNTGALRELQAKVAEAQQSSQAATSNSRLTKGLHAAMRDGRITGVVGRLGDLASVDPQFDIAVGAAAGARLDNIVVRSSEAAQAVIHLLRRENLGRATFVILNKIQYLERNINGWQQDPRSADGPRLFDYLNIPKPEHRVALYHALGDTLVANSLDEARRMAFKPSRKNKVVTTSGDLIESSGAMSGGGRDPPRQRLGKGGNAFEVDPRALQKAMEDLEAVQNVVREAERNLAEAQSERRSLSLGIEQIENRRRRAAMDMESLQSRVVILAETQIPELRKTVAAANKAQKGSERKKIKDMEKRIADGEKGLEAANSSCEGIQNDITQLQNDIVAAGGERLQNAKEEVESNRAKLSAEKSKSSKAASRAKEAEKAIKKAEQVINKTEKEIEANAKERDESKAEKDKLEDQAAEMVSKHEEAKVKYDEALEVQVKAQEEYAEVRDALKAQRRDEVSLKERLSESQRSVRACKAEIKECRKEMRKIECNVKRINDMIYGALGVEGNEDDDAEEDMDVDKEFKDAKDGEEDEEEEDKMEVDNDEGGKDGIEKETEDSKILTAAEKSRLANEIATLQAYIKDKNPDLRAIAEYKEKEQECKEHEGELDKVTEQRDTVRKSHDKLCKRRHDEFKTGFDEICKKLKELYQMITLGGDAELEFVDSMYPFTEGIVFSVRPPKKSWKNISNLSGGEKTLSSLALVFALHYYKPTPLYFLDEIDAALDFKNVSIVANYVKERTKNAQFIIISLRNNMFELADRLVGIYKTHHSTKSVTVNPRAFVSVRGR